MKNKEIVNFIFSPLAKSLTLPDDNYKYFALYTHDTCLSVKMPTEKYIPLFPNKWSAKRFLSCLEKEARKNFQIDILCSKLIPKLIDRNIPVVLTSICFDEEYENFVEGIIYMGGSSQTRIIVTKRSGQI